MRGFNLNWASKYRNELFGIAIISIIVFHFAEDVRDAVKQGAISTDEIDFIVNCALILHKYVGSIGVDQFLFLSGVGLFYSYNNNPNRKEFYRKRFSRIFIPYVLVGTIFWFLKDIVLGNGGIEAFIMDITFYSFFARGVRNIWFIALISVLYIVFPVLYRAMSLKNGTLLSVILLLLSIVVPLVTTENPVLSNIEIATKRVPIFIAGAIMARPIYHKKRIPIWSAYLYILIAFSLRIYLENTNGLGNFSRYISGLYAIGWIFIWCIFIKQLPENNGSRKFLRLTGGYSLELYLTHVTLRSLMKAVGIKTFFLPSYIVMVIFAIIGSKLVREITIYCNSRLFKMNTETK